MNKNLNREVQLSVKHEIYWRNHKILIKRMFYYKFILNHQLKRKMMRLW